MLQDPFINVTDLLKHCLFCSCPYTFAMGEESGVKAIPASWKENMGEASPEENKENMGEANVIKAIPECPEENEENMGEESAAALVAAVGGDMATSIVPYAEDGGEAGDKMVSCISCHNMSPMDKCIQKQKDNALTNRKAKYICIKCNNLNGRINSLLQDGDPEIIGYRQFSKDERARFAIESADLCGEDLKKKLEEHINWSRISKDTVNSSWTGHFEDIEDVKIRMKEKPEQLANLLLNAPRQVHPHTKATHIWIATMKLDCSREDTRGEKRERHLESDQVVKAKKIKALPDRPRGNKKGDGKGSKADVEKVERELDIPPNSIKRIETMLPAGEDVSVQVNV